MPTHSGMPCGSAQPKMVCCVTSETQRQDPADEQHGADDGRDGQEDAGDGARGVAHVRRGLRGGIAHLLVHVRATGDASAAAAGAIRAASGSPSRTFQSFFLRGRSALRC